MKTLEEFYGKDYARLKRIKDEVIQIISHSELSSIQYTLSRIKSSESVMHKLKQKHMTLDELHDIIGIRIICSFNDEIYTISDWVSMHFKVIEIKDYMENPKPSGYRSYHMIIEYDHQVVEIQIRTIAQDCWANLEHKIHYKKTIKDETLIKNELKRVADEIASLDLSLQAIKEMIEEENLCTY